MVKNGQHEIVALPYRAGVGAPPGVEVLDFPGLAARATGHGVDPYGLQRPAFHKLIAVRSGTLRCSLDFIHHELGAGRWLWVRPGQLHRYDSDLRGAEGRIVLFLSGFLERTTAEVAGADRGTWQPDPRSTVTEADSLWRVLDLLEDAHTKWGESPSDVQAELLRHLLAVLVLRLAATRGVNREPVGGAAFADFQAAVERDFARTHRVEDYATLLGYSVRSLTRASQEAVGCGAKRFIDDRILLESKRLLIHTDAPVASVAQRVGFPNATVFTKFFRKHTELTPTEFRRRGA